MSNLDIIVECLAEISERVLIKAETQTENKSLRKEDKNEAD